MAVSTATKRVAKSVVTIGAFGGLLVLLRYWLTGNALALAGAIVLAAASPLWLIWIYAEEMKPVAGNGRGFASEEWRALLARIHPAVRVTELVAQTAIGLWVGVMAETPWLVLAGFWVIRYCLIGIGGGTPTPSKGTVSLLLLSILGCAIGEWTRR